MKKYQQDALEGYIKFLNPKVLRSNLIAVSLFLAAYETLRSSIITQLRGLFVKGFDQNGEIVDSDYQKKVLSRHKSPLRASLLWFKEMQAIGDEEIELVERVRLHRNDLAHDLPTFIATNEKDINIELIGGILDVVTKVDRWWIREVEIPTNPDFDETPVYDLDDSEIISGNMLFLQLSIRIATGEDDESEAMYRDFIEKAAERLAGT
jgi:hypothetical protein